VLGSSKSSKVNSNALLGVLENAVRIRNFSRLHTIKSGGFSKLSRYVSSCSYAPSSLRVLRSLNSQTQAPFLKTSARPNCPPGFRTGYSKRYVASSVPASPGLGCCTNSHKPLKNT